jgi:zinc protease
MHAMPNICRTSLLAGALAGFLCLSPFPHGWAQSTAGIARSDIPRLAFEKYTLPNGLQVILHTDHKLPMVHVDSWYHVGSKNEAPGRTGFAHLFEHMMFEGSKNANAKYLSFIERAGANIFEGGVNGTTSDDRTNYYVTLPSGNLEYALWLESDRLATLTDVLTQAKLDNERNIVENERLQRVENTPYGRAFPLIYENLFPASHPYRHSVLGSHEDLATASVDDVKNFFHTYYTPNNLSLAITGDFDIATAKRLIEKYYGPIPTGPALDRPKEWVPSIDTEKIVDVNDHVPQERTYFVWPAPAYFGPGDADLDLVSLILTDGLSSRLTKSLVYEKQLCSDVTSFQESEEIGGFFLVSATARSEASLPKIESVLGQEIHRLATDGPTVEEISRAKAKWEFQYVTGLERIGASGGQGDVLNLYNTFLGDPDKFALDVRRHRDATQSSLMQAVAKWLDTNKRLLIRFHPERFAAPVGPLTLDRSKQPALAADLPFHVPDVQTASLDNGIKLFVVERRDLPKVAVRLAARAGSIADPAGLDGLASLTTEMMIRGTKSASAFEIDDRLGNLGVSLDLEADREYSALSLEVLRSNLAAAVSIMADVARNPSFPDDELQRQRKIHLGTLSQVADDPRAVSRRLAPMLAFGRDHPYGRPVRGLKSTIDKIEKSDLEGFHEKYWKPGSAALVFVGDISLDEAVALSKQTFGSWTGGAAPTVAIGPARPMGQGKVFLVNHPDAAQTVVSQILTGPTRDASEYYPFTLADAVWGGGAGARLGMNLREDKAYSYGVYTFRWTYSANSMWMATGGVQSDKTKESLIEFQRELHFIAGEKPITDNELATAQRSRIRGYAQQFEAMSRVCDQIVSLFAVGRPVTDLQREPEELDRATLASVNAAAEKFAAPSHATLLLVGDRSKIEAGVRSLNIGEVVLVDAEGNPVRSTQ